MSQTGSIAWQPLCDHEDHPPSQAGSAYISDAPIRPSQCKSTAQRDFLVGATESARVPAADEPSSVPGMVESFNAPDDIHGDDEEVEVGRVPKSRKFPDSVSAEELRVHSLTHLPYHPDVSAVLLDERETISTHAEMSARPE